MLNTLKALIAGGLVVRKDRESRRSKQNPGRYGLSHNQLPSSSARTTRIGKRGAEVLGVTYRPADESVAIELRPGPGAEL